MNPLNDAQTCSQRCSELYVTNDLLVAAKYRGCKVSLVSGLSLRSYHRDYLASRKDEYTGAAHETMIQILQSQYTKQFSKDKYTIELSERENTIGFVSFTLCTNEIAITYLSVSRENQKKGVGALLMDLVKSVAKEKNIYEITLKSEKNTVSYYENKIKMNVLAVRGYFTKMGVRLSESEALNNSKLNPLNLTVPDSRKISPIPYKSML